MITNTITNRKVITVTTPQSEPRCAPYQKHSSNTMNFVKQCIGRKWILVSYRTDGYRPIGEMDLQRVQFLERSLYLLIKFTNSIGSFEAFSSIYSVASRILVFDISGNLSSP